MESRMATIIEAPVIFGSERKKGGKIGGPMTWLGQFKETEFDRRSRDFSNLNYRWTHAN
jgi:hypothetical protein